MKSTKIYNNLEFPGSTDLHWYIGQYLSMTRVFMSIVRKKMVDSKFVQAILIPVFGVRDPVTGRRIMINITDRYFFVGTDKPLESELDLGIQSHLGTITVIRHDTGTPKETTIQDIQKIIYAHKHKKIDTIQENVMVSIKSGTFKDWEGIVLEKKATPDHVTVDFVSDDYHCILDMPVALCEPA